MHLFDSVCATRQDRRKGPVGRPEPTPTHHDGLCRAHHGGDGGRVGQKDISVETEVVAVPEVPSHLQSVLTQLCDVV